MMPDLRDVVAVGMQCRKRFFELNEDLDGLITDDPIHIGYLSGYRSVLQDMPPYSQILVATRDKVCLVTGASDAAAALEALEAPDCIWRYGEFYVFNSGDVPSCQDMPAASSTATEALSALLQTAPGLNSIGVDLGSSEFSHALEKSLPNAKKSKATDRLKLARAVKLPAEHVMLRHISRITDQAISDVAPRITPGTTELEVAAEISRSITLAGGVPRFLVVTSGERCSRVDAYASSRAFHKGDVVRIDIGASFYGYYSDMARSYAVGNVDEKVRSRYDALLRGETLELSMVRAGIPAREIFEAAIAEVRSSAALPFYQRNHCGHGIGLRAHEFPLIGPNSETILEPGMVLCLETPYYEIGWGGMMVEDTVIVTEDGCELLTHSSRDLCQSRR